MSQNTMKKIPENPQKYLCEKCDYFTFNKKDYNKHVNTKKHKILCDSIFDEDFVPKAFYCNCGKKYKHSSSLWNHKKKCIEKFETPTKIDCQENDEYNYFEDSNKAKELINPNSCANKDEIIFQLLKDNQDFKNLIIEQNKTIMEMAKDTKTMTINNTTNNKFNMNIFLNEKCKDALNIMDFVTSLPLNMEDLEETGKQGYVKGLSRILVNGLKGIDISKRPIHCSDLKRETLYIKDNNVWEKEDAEKKKIKNAIKYISLKNAKQITQWTKVNEGYRDSHNKKSDVYLKLVYEANGGDDDELNKIIKNISSNVTINKDDCAAL